MHYYVDNDDKRIVISHHGDYLKVSSTARWRGDSCGRGIQQVAKVDGSVVIGCFSYRLSWEGQSV